MSQSPENLRIAVVDETGLEVDPADVAKLADETKDRLHADAKALAAALRTRPWLLERNTLIFPSGKRHQFTNRATVTFLAESLEALNLTDSAAMDLAAFYKGGPKSALSTAQNALRKAVNAAEESAVATTCDDMLLFAAGGRTVGDLYLKRVLIDEYSKTAHAALEANREMLDELRGTVSADGIGVYKLGRSKDSETRDDEQLLPLDKGVKLTVPRTHESAMEAAMKKHLGAENRDIQLVNNKGELTKETFVLSEAECALVVAYFSVGEDALKAKVATAFDTFERDWRALE